MMTFENHLSIAFYRIIFVLIFAAHNSEHRNLA